MEGMCVRHVFEHYNVVNKPSVQKEDQQLNKFNFSYIKSGVEFHKHFAEYRIPITAVPYMRNNFV